MSNIGIHVRSNYFTNFGGDVKAIDCIKEGMEFNGAKVNLSTDLNELTSCDLVFLTNSCLPIVEPFLKSKNIPTGVITFYEDFSKYHIPSVGFYNYIATCLDTKQKTPNKVYNFSIDNLRKNKDIVNQFLPNGTEPNVMFNKEVFEGADVCVTSSEHEKKSLLRDHPTANVQVVQHSPGVANEWDDTADSSNIFTDKFDLEPTNYFLQVGRFETRKNQLCTILSTAEFDNPVVFIANKGYCKQYPEVVVKTALKYSNSRVIIISDWLKSQKIKNVEIYNTNDEFGGMLPADYLKSAYRNCLANVHPAFYELPGYTYIESSITGRPSVASNWTAIKDYIDNELMYFCEPHDINSNIEMIDKIINSDISYPTITKKDFNSIEETGSQYLEIINNVL